MENQALSKVQRFYLKRKRMPSYKELQKLFNNPPCTAVAYSVFKWKQAGILTDEGQALKPTSKFFGLPLLGTIKAGYPTAEEGYLKRMLLHDYLIDNPKTSYLLQISQGGLPAAGIHAGDVVIIDKSRQPEAGDIVAACFGTEWLISPYPAEQHNKTTIARRTAGLSISVSRSPGPAGVVVSVIRKFG